MGKSSAPLLGICSTTEICSAHHGNPEEELFEAMLLFVMPVCSLGAEERLCRAVSASTREQGGEKELEEEEEEEGEGRSDLFAPVCRFLFFLFVLAVNSKSKFILEALLVRSDPSDTAETSLQLFLVLHGEEGVGGIRLVLREK